MDRHVHPTDPEIIQKQHQFIRSVFRDECGDTEDDEEEGYDSNCS